MDSKNSESYLKDHLLALQKEGQIKEINIEYLTSYISGGLNELAIRLSRLQSFHIGEIESAIRMLLKGIRK